MLVEAASRRSRGQLPNRPINGRILRITGGAVIHPAHTNRASPAHNPQVAGSKTRSDRLRSRLRYEDLHVARRNELCRDPRGRRLWFPRSDQGAREITYRARVREATRTVTKPNVSRTSGKIRYWEHDALRFAFRRFGDSWVLQLLPTIVFTTDGHDDLHRGPRVGPLATRRMARVFNPQIQNDLFFWRWALARGEPMAKLDDTVKLHASFIARDVVDAPHATGGLGADEDEEAFADDIDDEVAELVSDQIADEETLEEKETEP
jgi:hypothetical protein